MYNELNLQVSEKRLSRDCLASPYKEKMNDVLLKVKPSTQAFGIHHYIEINPYLIILPARLKNSKKFN